MLYVSLGRLIDGRCFSPLAPVLVLFSLTDVWVIPASF